MKPKNLKKEQRVTNKIIIMAVLIISMLNLGLRNADVGEKPEIQTLKWQAPLLIDAGPNNAYRAKLAFDRKGNAIAVFEQKRGNVFRMYASRYVRGNGWQKPITISDAGMGNSDVQSPIPNSQSKIENAYHGQVAFDRRGNALAVFKQGTAIYANSYMKGKGWQGPERISDLLNPQSPIRDPLLDVDGQQVVFDMEGNAAVVFEGHDGMAYKIYANRYIKGDGWQVPVLISESEIHNSKSNAYFPYPAFDKDGALYVIYYKKEGDGIEIYVSRHDAIRNKWAAPVRLTESLPPAKIEERRRFVARGLSDVHNPPFWGTVKEKIYSGSYDYQGWETPSKIDTIYRDAYRPSLLIDRGSNVMALFVRWDGERARGYMAVKRVGEGWGAPKLIDADSEIQNLNNIRQDNRREKILNPARPVKKVIRNQEIGNVEYMRAAINTKGEIVIVFSQWVNAHSRVYARLYTPSSGLGEAEIIDAGENNVYNPSVVFTDDGEIIAVWCQWERENVKSYANIYKKGRGWGKAVRLDRAAGETCGVRVHSGPKGKVIAIFEQEVPSPGRSKLVNRIFATELR